MPFEKDSGLVYKEKIVSALSNRRRTTFTESRSYKVVALSAPNRSGSRPLRETMIRKMLCNLDALDARSLDGVPQPILELLWLEVLRYGLSTLSTWQTFAQSPLAMRSSVYTEQIKRNCLTSNLETFSRAGSSMAWLTTLTLGDRQVSSVELSGVTKVQNVRNIFISATQSGGPLLTDNILHSWADAVKTEGAFRRLELLFVDGQRRISYGGFHHLSHFPALQTFVVSRSGISVGAFTGDNEHLTQSLGWRSSKDNGLLRFACELTCDVGGLVSTSDLFAHYVKRSRGLGSSEGHHTLNLALGDANHSGMWTHREALCFERDWTVVPPMPQNEAEAEAEAGSELAGEARLAKKRRIRTSKGWHWMTC